MPITNSTNLRKNLYETLDHVIEYNEALTITTKKGNAVILSEDDYNALLESLYLLSQPGLIDKIKQGEDEDVKSMKEYDPKKAW